MSNNIFVDLNILHDPSDQKTTTEVVKLAVELGYDVVAINIDVGDVSLRLSDEAESTSGAPKGKKRKKQQEKMKSIPAPFKVDPRHLDFAEREATGKQPFRQYSRLTLTVEDPDMVHNALKHPTIQEYDIVAVYPKTEPIFTTIINKTEIDMITMDMNERAPWVSKGRLVQMAIEKGITFEISYSSALSDSSQRREAFCNGRDMVRACGRKRDGLVFSSRATRPIELRSPFDAANLTLLFGVNNAEDGRRTIGANAKRLLLRAEAKRKTLKGVMAVEDVDKMANRGLLEKLSRIPEFRVEIEKVPEEDEEGKVKKKSESSGP